MAKRLKDLTDPVDILKSLQKTKKTSTLVPLPTIVTAEDVIPIELPENPSFKPKGGGKHKAEFMEIPPGTKFKKYHYWCPYCGKATHFREDSYTGVKRCELCGISNQDFYVKKVNKGVSK
jgi:ribosomal protein L37AE/L43A